MLDSLNADMLSLVFTKCGTEDYSQTSPLWYLSIGPMGFGPAEKRLSPGDSHKLSTHSLRVLFPFWTFNMLTEPCRVWDAGRTGIVLTQTWMSQSFWFVAVIVLADDQMIKHTCLAAPGCFYSFKCCMCNWCFVALHRMTCENVFCCLPGNEGGERNGRCDCGRRP